MIVKKFYERTADFVILILMLSGSAAEAKAIKCLDLFASQSLPISEIKSTVATEFRNDRESKIVPRPPIVEISSTHEVFIERISKEPELLSFPVNSNLFNYGVDPNIRTSSIKVGDSIPFLDGTAGVVVKKEKSFWHKEEYIDVTTQTGEIKRMYLNRPLRHWGRKYRLHVISNGTLRKIEIWDGSTNAQSKDVSLVDRVAKAISELSEVELNHLEFLRLNPFLYPENPRAAGTASFVDRKSGRPGEIDLYGNIHRFDNHFLRHVLSHEIGHQFAVKQFGTFEPPLTEWENAMKSDKGYVSEYARTNNAEDFAESFEAYFSKREWLQQKFPARYKLLKKYVNQALEAAEKLKPIKKEELVSNEDRSGSNVSIPKPLTQSVIAARIDRYNEHYKLADGSSISVLTASTRGKDDREPQPKYSHNEDSIAIVPLFDSSNQGTGFSVMIADGMGGYRGGDIASEAAVKSYVNLFNKGYSAQQIIPRIPIEIQKRYEEGRRRGLDISDQMGTAVVVAEVENGLLTLSHVGDSRAVVFRNGEIIHKTKDDSYVAQLGLSEEEMMVHSQNNIILKALRIDKGFAAELHRPTQSQIAVKKNDFIVMASDGMWDFVSSAEVNTLIIKLKEPDLIKKELLKLVDERNGNDNITIAVIRYGT